MKSVWSYWSKPFVNERRASWHSERHHWLAWGLSLAVASRHYPETCLVTDDDGARILIDELGLPFQHVSTALNAIADEDPAWWALGKIEAYRLQRDPFVHVDTDVFLWKPLAPELESGDVFTQCPEPILRGASCYHPEELEEAAGPDAWLPPEWIWYRDADSPRAECCGIFGGNRIDFINYYATAAMRMVQDPANRPGLGPWQGKHGQMILVEQYLLSACVDYHQSQPDSAFRDVTMRYVFDSMGDGFRRDAATEAGFTHLAADSKRNQRIARYLERRVRQDLSHHYERCLRYMHDHSEVAALFA